MTFNQANNMLAAVAAKHKDAAFAVQYKSFSYGGDCGDSADTIACRLYLGHPVQDSWEASTWAEAFTQMAASLYLRPIPEAGSEEPLDDSGAETYAERYAKQLKTTN